MIPNFLFPHYCKWLGWILFGAGVLGHLVFGFYYFLLFLSLALLGLFVVASSRQQVEDEMIQSIRLRSLQTAVFVQVLFILGFSLLDDWKGEGLVNLPIPAVLAGILFVGIYLLVFHYKIYRLDHEE
ncbi:hypothetical protein [Mongoliitalea lutea]|uniref:DUF2178 domain-containing protein n=1 Tax=Mongoliitalea lutea TaxID=849756 RepID=A0A8J3CVN4_9BACT|nr:hypothetical protein [Mongoliitalea lutea]GHB33310.1 hypothetical protein GCM10008106_12840 [Mongoliitalea lutea]